MRFQVKKKINKRYWSLVTAWVILLMVASMTITAVATADLTSTVAVSGLTVSSSGGTDWSSTSSGSATWSGTTTSSGGCSPTYTQTNGELTLKNTSGEAKVLSFTYTSTLNGGTMTIDGSTPSGTTYKKSLNNGDSVIIKVSSPSGAAKKTTVTLSNITLSVPDVTVTFEPASNGSYTVDGTEITSTATRTVPATTLFNLAATPAEHYVFQGWYLNDVLYSTGETLSSVAFPDGGTITAKFTADPLYNSIAVAEGSSYGKDDLVEINSRYYHDPSTDLKNYKMVGVMSESFYTVGGYTTVDGDAYSQRVPNLSWTAGTKQVSISDSVTAGGEYVAKYGNSWAYYNGVSDVIQIYAKEDCVISFDYATNITKLDLSMNTEGTWSRLHMLQSTNGNIDYPTLFATATRFPTSEAEYEASLGSAKAVSYSLPKGEYLYIFANGYTEVNSLRFAAGYSNINISYSATLSNFTVASNEVSYTQTTRFEDNLGNPLPGGVLRINATNYNAETDGSVAGLQFLEGTTMTQSVATAPNNYRFVGWRVNDSTELICTPTYEYVLNSNTTVDPVFAPNNVTFDADAGTYQYLDNNGNTVTSNGEYVARNEDATAFYTSLAEAFTATDVTVLLGNMTIEGNFEVPSGEVLVVPNTTNTISATFVSNQYVPSLDVAGSGEYAVLTVKGSLGVSGTLLVAGYQSGSSGSPAGRYATMTVNGTVTIKNGGALYGYGLVNGSGTIYANSGSQVHELCEILDKRHPATMKNLIDKADQYGITPFSVLNINTIEAKTTYESGAALYGHFSVSWGTPAQEKIKVIDQSASTFVLTSGTLSKFYDATCGQVVYRVDEGAVVNTGNFDISMKITFSGATETASFSSANFVMPISSGWQLQIAGNFNVSNDYKVLPGAKVDVESSGVLSISDTANLIFYRLNDYDYRSNANSDTTSRGFCATGYPVNMSRHYTFSRDNVGSAKLNVDGTINANGGLYVTDQLIEEYTTENTALAYQNYSYYDNGFNFLTGSGTIHMGERTSPLTQIYENLTNGQNTDVQPAEVTVVPMKGLNADATENIPENYVELTGTVKGRTNSSGLNVWEDDPCAAGHTLEAVAEKDATCTEEGNIAHWSCSVCEKLFSDEAGTEEVTEVATEINPDAHSYGEATYAWSEDNSSVSAECVCEFNEEHKLIETVEPGYEIVTDASCLAEGAGLYTAVFENEAFAQQTKEVVIPATGHNYEVTESVDATCTENGYKVYTCKNDGTHTYTEPLNAAGHDLTQVEAKAPTCTEAGHEAYEYCSACDYTTYKEVAATDHDFDEGIVTTAPTCTEKGIKTFTCQNDASHTYTEEIPMVAHTEATREENRAEPTCGKDGSYDLVTFCSTCSTVIKTEPQTISATGNHTWTEATCTAPQTCSECGETEGEALGHDEEDIPAVDATCEKTGLTAGVKCSVCGETLTEQEEIPATGHINTTTTYEHVENTETHIVTVTCECGEQINQTTEDCVDEDKDGVCDLCNSAVVYPAYTEMVILAEELQGENAVNGNTVTLTVTGDVAYTRAQGTGAWGNWVGFKLTAPDGVAMTNVTILRPDNATRNMDTIKDGDNYAYLYWNMTKVTDKQVTYQVDWNGDEIYDLTVILNVTNATLAACEHTWDEGVVTTEPTCTETGVMTYICGNCGETKTETADTLEHDMVEVEGKASTCTEAGYTAHENCSRCDHVEGKEEIPATGHDFELCEDQLCCKNCDVVVQDAPNSTFEETTAGEVAHDDCDSLNNTAIPEFEVIKPQFAIRYTPELNASETQFAEYPLDVYITFENISDADALKDGCYLVGQRQKADDRWLVQRLSDYTLESGTAYAIFEQFLQHSTTYASIASLSGDWMVGSVYLTEEAMEANPNLSISLEPRLDLGEGNYWNFDQTFTYQVEVHKHSYDEVVTAPTCTEQGYTTYTCANCDDSYVDNYVDAKGHTEEALEAVDPTCTATGLTAGSKCSVCQMTLVEQNVVPALGHDEVHHDAKAPTCKDVGWDAYVTCSRCDYSTYKEILATGDHAWDEGEVTTEPTCTETGVRTFTCGNCGETKTVTVDAVGHDYKAEVTAPTCGEKGYTSYTCACGDSYVDDYVDATGNHNYVDGKCDVCGSVTGEIVLTDYMIGWTSQIGLIEPWFLRVDAVIADSNKKQIDYSTVTESGFYFVRARNLELSGTPTTKQIVENANAVIYDKDSVFVQKIGAFDYFATDYNKGIYTYEMSESIYAVFYFSINDGVRQYTTPKEFNLKQLLEQRKDDTVKFPNPYERAVYQKMYDLENYITTYREGKSDTLTKMGQLLQVDTLGNPATDLKYKFAAKDQIVLIEPWGLQVNVAIVPPTGASVSDHIDYDAVDDYGVVMYYDVDGVITDSSMLDSPEEMLALINKAYVFSKTDGSAFQSKSFDGYVTARYNQGIYTFQLNTSLYTLYYAKIDGQYYYDRIRSYNVYDLAKTRATTFTDVEECNVYAGMVDLHDAVTVYRDDYFSRNPQN